MIAVRGAKQSGVKGSHFASLVSEIDKDDE